MVITNFSQDDPHEKRWAAMSSVIGAAGLMGFKIVVGLTTGSLRILAEAAHSGLDLMTALMTFLAVRISAKPADSRQQSSLRPRQGTAGWERSSRAVEVYLGIICTAVSQTGNPRKELIGKIAVPHIEPSVEERYGGSIQVKNQQGHKNS
jgi:hypothetical protein